MNNMAYTPPRDNYTPPATTRMAPCAILRVLKDERSVLFKGRRAILTILFCKIFLFSSILSRLCRLRSRRVTNRNHT